MGSATGSATGSVRLTARVRGHVQGVGFRLWTQRVADGLGLSGSATNRPDGSVQVVAEGPRPACAQLLEALRGSGAPGRVSGVDVTWGDATGAAQRFVTG